MVAKGPRGGVVWRHRDEDHQFRAEAVDAGDQYWFAHPGEIWREKPAEAADFSENFRAVSFSHPGVDAFLDEIPEINIHARTGVRFFCHAVGEAVSFPREGNVSLYKFRVVGGLLQIGKQRRMG